MVLIVTTIIVIITLKLKERKIFIRELEEDRDIQGIDYENSDGSDTDKAKSKIKGNAFKNTKV